MFPQRLLLSPTSATEERETAAARTASTYVCHADHVSVGVRTGESTNTVLNAFPSTMLKSFSICVLTALASLALTAQTPAVEGSSAPQAQTTKKDPLDRTSPQSTMYGFLEACRKHDYLRATHFLDLRDKKPEERLKIGPELAQQLQEVLDRDSQFDLSDLSAEPEGDRSDGLPPDLDELATFTFGKTSDRLDLQRITGKRGYQLWLVSSASLKKIPDLHRRLTENPLENSLPAPLVETQFLSTAIWKWLAFGLLIIALFVLSGLLSRAIVAVFRRIFARGGGVVSGATFEEFVNPIRLLVSIVAFRACEEIIGPSALMRLYIDRLLTLLFFLGVAWLVSGLVDVFSARIRRKASPRQAAAWSSIIPLFGRIIKIVIFLAALLETLSNWGYNTNTLLAGLGVGGLAIALAAQKTLENLFGGVSVIGDRPVLVGDFCKFGSQSGTIEDIGLRSTRIRTNDRTVVSVPNSQFSTMTLENLSKRDRFLFNQVLHLRFDAKTAQIQQVMDRLINLFKSHPKVDPGKVPVRFTGIGTYSFNLEIFVYITTTDGDEYNAIQSELLMKILDIVEAADTGLAIPMQENVTIAAHNGQSVTAPPEPVAPSR
jgi:MscS family membrane protein